jgi:hypothetical protein
VCRKEQGHAVGAGTRSGGGGCGAAAGGGVLGGAKQKRNLLLEGRNHRVGRLRRSRQRSSKQSQRYLCQRHGHDEVSLVANHGSNLWQVSGLQASTHPYFEWALPCCFVHAGALCPCRGMHTHHAVGAHDAGFAPVQGGISAPLRSRRCVLLEEPQMHFEAGREHVTP